MTILVSHQAVPHILQQNCAHDTLTITISTSQLIVTSAHYIAKALVRKILNSELIEVTMVSVTLSMCTF